MSSETRKKACRSSIIQPRAQVGKKALEEGDEAGGVVGLSRETVSGTERPRLHFPPRVFVWRDCVLLLLGRGGDGGVWGVRGETDLLEPLQRVVW